MPIYEYYCEANNTSIEIHHSIAMDKFKTWGELCEFAKLDLENIPADTPVERLAFPVNAAFPKGDAKLKELGMTKLVKRDDGVYENVTQSGSEKKYMKRGDASSIPHVHKKISD